MDPRLQVLIARHGVFFRWEALDLGYDDKTLAKLVRRGVLHRVRRGAYTYSALWQAATPEEQHRIRCRAVMRVLGGGVALSHVSNLVMRGVATWGVDLSRVHVTRLDGGASRIEPDLVHHRGSVSDGELELVGGILATPADRAVMESLILTGVEPGLVIADSALHRGIIVPEDLERSRRELERWPGMRSAQLVVRLADGRAESPGESRVRYICWEQGLPKPDLQVEIRDAQGNLVAVTDFGWEKHKLLGEFDGRVKYGRLLKPGQEPGDIVMAEKEREDLIREITDCGMIRYMWDHLSDRRGVALRTLRRFRRAA